MKIVGLKFLIILIFGCLININANTDEIESCAKFWKTTYCAPFGGSAIIYKQTAYCGLGECMVFFGKVICSNKQGGRIATSFNEAKCSGGCVPGDPNLCEVLK